MERGPALRIRIRPRRARRAAARGPARIAALLESSKPAPTPQSSMQRPRVPTALRWTGRAAAVRPLGPGPARPDLAPLPALHRSLGSTWRSSRSSMAAASSQEGPQVVVPPHAQRRGWEAAAKDCSAPGLGPALPLGANMHRVRQQWQACPPGCSLGARASQPPKTQTTPQPACAHRARCHQTIRE
jgi:hypothetical protein